MTDPRWVAVVDEPEAFAFGPFDTVEEASTRAQEYANNVNAESTDEWPRVYPYVPAEQAESYTPPQRTSKAAEFYLEEDVAEAHNRQGPAYDDVPDEVV